MSKILVMGSSGMLGHMVFGYLRRNAPAHVIGTESEPTPGTQSILRFRVGIDDIDVLLQKVKPSYIINCIGIIKPYCKDNDMPGVRKAIVVNGLFPHDLANAADKYNAKIIQIATDCVYDGTGSNYNELAVHNPTDVYGKSKSLGEIVHPNVLHVRSSIIGPEKGKSSSLLEWFLSQGEGAVLKGFTDHLWNGVTTLQYAKLCDKIIKENSFNRIRSLHHTLHFAPNSTVSKYELLKIFAKFYNKSNQIEPTQSSLSVNRTISTLHPGWHGFPTTPMEQAIKDLADYRN